METIRQNGKTILYSNDGISIKMVFKNLTGRNFQGQEYTDYIRHIAIGSMGFSPGIIEHCRDGEVARDNPECMKTETPMKLAASSEFLSSDTYSLWYIQQRKLSLPSFEQHGVAFPLIVTESDILPVDVPVTRLQLSD